MIHFLLDTTAGTVVIAAAVIGGFLVAAMAAASSNADERSRHATTIRNLEADKKALETELSTYRMYDETPSGMLPPYPTDRQGQS